jgi:Na+-driven multidrug efflux pump
MMLTLVSQWVLQFPLAYVLSMHTPLKSVGIWWAFPIANVSIAAITAMVYARGDWKKKRLVTPEQQLERAVAAEIVVEEGAVSRRTI